MDDWRILEVLKLLRQCVTCPTCGVLVATKQGIDSHIAWHENLQEYVDNVNAQLTEFSNYIINPNTGLEKKISDRLDTITNYVVAPTTGLEPRVTAAITQTNGSVAQLRSDATAAITSLQSRVTALEQAVNTLLNK